VLLCLLVIYLVLAGVREFSHWCCQGWANPLLELADQEWYVKLVYYVNTWSAQLINANLVVSFFAGSWAVYELVLIIHSFA